jgi:aryl-alcohol dehydrogenase-like predicted oxidoreductase
VHPIADLQIEYSVGSRGAAAGIFSTLRALGVSATLYGVFSRGLLTGSKPKGGGDFRAHLPRFVGEDGARNEAVASAVHALAKETQRTPSQLLLGWVLATQPGFVPLVGARTVAQVEDALGVVERPLHEDEVRALGAITERLSGDRYGAAHMAQLDSER